MLTESVAMMHAVWMEVQNNSRVINHRIVSTLKLDVYVGGPLSWFRRAGVKLR